MEPRTTISDAEPIVEERTGINVELLEQVAAAIERNSKKFDMRHWRGSEMNKVPNTGLRKLLDLPQRKERCGTTYCIAGWTVHLGGGDMSGNLPAQAQRLLGLNFEQGRRLFYDYNWPVKFQRCQRTENDTDRAWEAAERIRHFIATDGKE